MRRKKALGALVVALISIYLWLPAFLKSQAEERLSTLLARQVTVGSVSVAPTELSVTIRDFRIASLLHISNLKANFSATSIAARLPILDELIVQSPVLALSRDTKGRLSIADLIETFAKPSPTPSEPPRFAVHNIRLTGGRMQFQDDLAGKTHLLSDLAITIPIIANRPSTREIWTEPHVSGKLNGAAFSVDGKTELFGKRKEAAIQFAINELDLAGVEKYANVVPGLAVQSAMLNTNLDVRFVQEESKPSSVAVSGNVSISKAALAYRSQEIDWLMRGSTSLVGKVAMDGKPLVVSGDAELSDFSILDRASATEIARGKTIKAASLRIAANPFAASIEAIDIDGLFFRPTLLADGRLNLTGVHQEVPKEKDQEKTAATEEAAAPEGSNTAPPATASSALAPPFTPGKKLPIDIGRVTLANSSLIFNDQFAKPNFRISISNLKGSIGRLSPGTKTAVELSGAIDRTAPLQAQGRIDPFNSDLFVDIAVKAKGIEMPPLSSYSIKYLAYPIEKGKLSLDLQYQLEDGQLKASNKIFLDQLTLGERVESPDALSIPVTLAVALLKNLRGEININLPISGSINDPHFKIGPIVFKALLNLIVKAATAPFTVLASIFGGGADLSNITFAPGSSRIEAQAESTMAAIAKAMLDRPALKLEITGTASTSGDVAGAKRNALMRRARAEKISELAAKGAAPAALKDVELSPDEYPKYLERVYGKADIKKPRNVIGFAKTLPVQEMENLLLDSISVSEADLLAIADARGRNARTYLANQGVPAERVFVLTSHLRTDTDKPGAGKAEFALK